MFPNKNWWVHRPYSYSLYVIRENRFNEAIGRNEITFIKVDENKGTTLKNFFWQNRYGAFSVNPTEIETVIAYIENQKEHHKKRTFQDEYRAFVKKYKVEYDERYIWD